MIKCAECRQACEDKTEYSVFKIPNTTVAYALHRWCVEVFFEPDPRTGRPKPVVVPPECVLSADESAGGWQRSPWDTPTQEFA